MGTHYSHLSETNRIALQFFSAGEPMPEAVLLGKPGLMQRIKGDAPTYRTATVWKLVDYEATPPAHPASIATPGRAAADAPQAFETTPTPPSERGNTRPTGKA